MTIKSKMFLGGFAVIALLLQGTAFAQATFTSSGGRIMTSGAGSIGDLYVKWAESGSAPGPTVT